MLRLLANREQNKANFLKVVESATGCCGTEGTECQYIYTDASLTEILSITIGGEVFTLDPDISAIYENMGDGADKRKYTRQVVLPYLFKEAGLVSDGLSVIISEDGETITIESEVAITLNAKEADTVNCTREAFCDYCFNTETVEDPVITVDGSDNTITGEWTYPASAAAFQTAIESALTDAAEVVVMDDTVNASFKVVITYPNGTSVQFNGTSVPCCSVEQGWSA